MATFFTDISDVQDLVKYRSSLKKASAKWDGEQFIAFDKLAACEGTSKSRVVVGQLNPTLTQDLKALAKAAKVVQRGVVKVEGEKVIFEVEKGSPHYGSVRDGLKVGGLDVTPVVRAAGSDSLLDTKSIGTQYKGEDKKVGWRSQNPEVSETDQTTTRYHNEEEREAHRLRVEGDKVVGPKIKGQTGYVMDPETGDLHTFGQDGSGQDTRVTLLDNGKRVTEHHSTPLAGKDVASAGYITLKETFIKRLDDSSGHYKPTPKMTFKAMQEMARKGFKLTDMTLVDIETGLPAKELQEAMLKLARLKAEREQIREQIERLQEIMGDLSDGASPSDFKELEGHTGDAVEYLSDLLYDLDNEEDDLVDGMKDVKRAIKKMPKIQVVPSLRETEVVLQGKQGLTDEEMNPILGNREALNALIEKKIGIPEFFPVGTELNMMSSKPFINIQIGNATTLSLKASQFLQTQGDEGAARVKDRAQKLVRRMGDAIKPSQIKTLEAVILEVDQLGGERRLEAMKLPPEEMDVFFQREVLTGALPVQKAMKQLYKQLGGDDAIMDLELDPDSISLSKRLKILTGRIDPDNWNPGWRLADHLIRARAEDRAQLRQEQSEQRRKEDRARQRREELERRAQQREEEDDIDDLPDGDVILDIPVNYVADIPLNYVNEDGTPLN